MTTLLPDSFHVASVGAQADSTRPSFPAHSFGTGARETARLKVFLSNKLEKSKVGQNSPGPVYNVPSTVGASKSHAFANEPARKHPTAKYPDSSVDLTCAEVDTQKVKFARTPGVHFGSEDRSSLKNAELIRTNAELAMGLESPGALEYRPKEVAKSVPAYSFAPADMTHRKPESRAQLLQSATPRHVGPGSHKAPAAMGNQPMSPRPSAPAWTMSGRSPRDNRQTELLSIEDKVFSSIGKQVLSTIASPPGVGVAKSTRDQAARTALFVSDAEPNFSVDLPATSRVSRPGL